MDDVVAIEIVGIRESRCSPFVCDPERSCGLSECYPMGTLLRAFEVLEKALISEFGDRVELKLTLIDDTVPPHIEKIISEFYPPIPIILVNGRVTPIGLISLPLIQKEISRCLGE